MIDKITPRPDASVKKMLEDAGFTDTESIVTSKNTYVAPFVNAEEAQYLVIENAFPNGRPALENAGVMFTSRDSRKSRAHESMHLLKSSAHCTGCIWLPVRLHQDQR